MPKGSHTRNKNTIRTEKTPEQDTNIGGLTKPEVVRGRAVEVLVDKMRGTRFKKIKREMSVVWRLGENLEREDLDLDPDPDPPTQKNTENNFLRHGHYRNGWLCRRYFVVGTG